MHEKAAYLALHGFVLTKLNVGYSPLPSNRLVYRVKRQREDGEYQLSVTWESKWEVNRSAARSLYYVVNWESMPNGMWQTLPWELVHQLVMEDSHE